MIPGKKLETDAADDYVSGGSGDGRWSGLEGNGGCRERGGGGEEVAVKTVVVVRGWKKMRKSSENRRWRGKCGLPRTNRFRYEARSA